MHFTALTTLVFAALTLVGASPLIAERQTYEACSGLYGNAQCCATDVLGVADLDCGVPTITPTDAAHFQSTCADMGRRARCCVLAGVLGQVDVLCVTPVGVSA
ncbi:Cerato-ulmin hydrophobin family [Roridomyces roridus]|uniref:Cerato-ulmin hydrophobin family n=1 Tax=Roridomyces roridus TaxID=1738132 RepID=A0AAD7C745_9AGAR|nr:Cerato-ulmin hydrophobin family [Roridomyces roridus]